MVHHSDPVPQVTCLLYITTGVESRSCLPFQSLCVVWARRPRGLRAKGKVFWQDRRGELSVTDSLLKTRGSCVWVRVDAPFQSRTGVRFNVLIHRHRFAFSYSLLYTLRTLPKWSCSILCCCYLSGADLFEILVRKKRKKKHSWAFPRVKRVHLDFCNVIVFRCIYFLIFINILSPSYHRRFCCVFYRAMEARWRTVYLCVLSAVGILTSGVTSQRLDSASSGRSLLYIIHRQINKSTAS